MSVCWVTWCHGAVVCTTTCNRRNYCRPRDPASWPNMAATPDDCEITATVALPTASSGGSISGDLGSSAALDAFSTVYELPLTRFLNRQTDKHTDMTDRYTSLYELRPREVIMLLYKQQCLGFCCCSSKREVCVLGTPSSCISILKFCITICIHYK